MAGFREFVTGEVLTAANVDDFLMKQSVQKYADAAARDAALGATVGGGNALRQGMVAYLDDVDELQKYDGNDWGEVGGGLVAVKEARSTDFFQTNSTTFTVVTGAEVTITPQSANNKIIVMFSCPYSQLANLTDHFGAISVFRDSTNLSQPDDTTANPSFAASNLAGLNQEFGNMQVASAVLLDSPSTTSPVVYSVRARSSSTSRSTRINRSNNLTQNFSTTNIVVMEVKV